MRSQLLILVHRALPLPAAAAGLIPTSPLFPELSATLTFRFLGQLTRSCCWVRHGGSAAGQCFGSGAWLFLFPSPATEEGSELPDSDARWARCWAGAVGGKSWDPSGTCPSRSALLVGAVGKGHDSSTGSDDLSTSKRLTTKN